ncbi:30S ribosomal protein S16 [Flavobacteriaceae bacterium]|nr:30S ribosomal protein S16 [Flavobacteriaceae bacterium]
MPVKIRLQRHGKKGKPYYWIVAADTRSKRDGKYLEKLGSYNPNVNPPIIELDIDGSVKWLQNGAQPTHTARNILSYKGVMLKHHLLGGVAKGALTLEEAETKLAAWLEEKISKIDSKISSLEKEEANKKAKELEAEKLVNKARSEAQVAAAEEAVAEEAVAEEVVADEAPAEEVVADEAVAEEAVAEEAVADEAPAEEVVAEEAVAEEAVADEAPKEDK